MRTRTKNDVLPQLCKRTCYSIESDESWANSVKKIMPKNVTMHCVPVVRPDDPDQKHAIKWDQLYTTKMYHAYKEYIIRDPK